MANPEARERARQWLNYPAGERFQSDADELARDVLALADENERLIATLETLQDGDAMADLLDGARTENERLRAERAEAHAKTISIATDFLNEQVRAKRAVAEAATLRTENERLQAELTIREQSQIPVVPRGAQERYEQVVAEAATLREALRALMDSLIVDEEGELTGGLDQWGNAWCKAVAALAAAAGRDTA